MGGRLGAGSRLTGINPCQRPRTDGPCHAFLAMSIAMFRLENQIAQ
jgi:hypothetical protein